MSSREPTSVAKAEAEAARAQERAEAARARAVRLRQLAEEGAPTASGAGANDGRDPNDTANESDSDAVDDNVEGARPLLAKAARIARLVRPGRKLMIVGGMAMLICASLVVSGLMLWQHRTIADEPQRRAEFAAAARRGVTVLTWSG